MSSKSLWKSFEKRKYILWQGAADLTSLTDSWTPSGWFLKRTSRKMGKNVAFIWLICKPQTRNKQAGKSMNYNISDKHFFSDIGEIVDCWDDVDRFQYFRDIMKKLKHKMKITWTTLSCVFRIASTYILVPCSGITIISVVLVGNA